MAPRPGTLTFDSYTGIPGDKARATPAVDGNVKVVWQTTPSAGGSAFGPVTTANGVDFGCSLDAGGHMYALDAATGEELGGVGSPAD